MKFPKNRQKDKFLASIPGTAVAMIVMMIIDGGDGRQRGGPDLCPPLPLLLVVSRPDEAAVVAVVVVAPPGGVAVPPPLLRVGGGGGGRGADGRHRAVLAVQRRLQSVRFEIRPRMSDHGERDRSIDLAAPSSHDLIKVSLWRFRRKCI